MTNQVLKPYRYLTVAARTRTNDDRPLVGVILHVGEEDTEYWVSVDPRPVGPLVHWRNQAKGVWYDVHCQGGDRPYPAGCTCPHAVRSSAFQLRRKPCRHMWGTQDLLERGELRSELPTPPAPSIGKEKL